MALCFDAKSYDEAMDEIEDYLNENAKPNKKCKKCDSENKQKSLSY